ncbi:MAG: Histidine kinase [Pedosphaera sp.]|nr:Histidine kinase [Pedosphaera sp.]
MLNSLLPKGFNVKNEATSGSWRSWFSSFYLCTSLLVAATAGAQTNREEGPRVVLSESEQAWVQKHPVVYWGTDPRWPPFSCFDKEGRIYGINVEMVKLLAKRTGLNMQHVKTPTWPETLQKAGTGEIDVVAGITRTEERKRMYGLKFTEVFCTFPTAIVTRKEMRFMMPLDEIMSKRIAMPRDYASTEELQRRYPNAHFVITDNEEQSMLMVAGNKADATVLNLASASYVAHMRGLSNLKISGFTDFDFFLSMAVRKDAPELHSILEKGLATINARDKEAIYAASIIPETRNAMDWRVWRRRAIYAVLAGAVASTAVLFWNRSLAREIRRRNTVEIALLQTRDKLETHARELHRRAGETQVLNEKLTLANKDLESFSYSVSHDLKSPLRRLRIFSELLAEEAGSNLNAEARQSLDVMRHEVGRMSELIEALLAYAQVGSAKMHLAPVKLEALAREVVREVEVETRGREIVWEIHPMPEVQCDRGLIKQVLANLVDNAIKFTRGRKPARIEIGVLPEKSGDEETVFYVKDNGAGFEMNYAGTLFETFHRLHHQVEYEGSGIGLANVKRIVLRHGGRVWAEGEVDKGATFYFSLPKKTK